MTVRRFLLPLLADLVCVLAFAFGGKSSHEAGDSDWVVLAIAWPFALATLVAHVALAAGRRSAMPLWPAGVVVLGTTYVLGMAIRVVEGRGIAPAFLVVAALFLALTLLGWRLLVDRAPTPRRR